MTRYLIAVVLGVALLGGCASPSPTIPRDATEVVTNKVIALRTLDEARIWAAAVANVVAAAADAGVYTPEERAKYKAELTRRLDDADRVERDIKTGVLGAETQAELLRNAMLSLHKKVAEEARKKP